MYDIAIETYASGDWGTATNRVEVTLGDTAILHPKLVADRGRFDQQREAGLSFCMRPAELREFIRLLSYAADCLDIKS